MMSSRRIETPQISKMLGCGYICTHLLVDYILTICARRYICAWLAVRVELDGLPRRTACWDILVGVELILWARLISWAAAGEVVRLIYKQRTIRVHLDNQKNKNSFWCLNILNQESTAVTHKLSTTCRARVTPGQRNNFYGFIII